jgi:hypothetical protein
LELPVHELRIIRALLARSASLKPNSDQGDPIFGGKLVWLTANGELLAAD